MASRSHAQLRATFQAYQKVSFKCVIKVIYKVILRYRVATLPGNLEFDNLGKKKHWKNLEF